MNRDQRGPFRPAAAWLLHANGPGATNPPERTDGVAVRAGADVVVDGHAASDVLPMVSCAGIRFATEAAG